MTVRGKDRGESSLRVPVGAFDGDRETRREDTIAVEEPMEIRVESGPEGERRTRSISVTMRTPGHDFELAVGFLFGEGLIAGRDDVRHLTFCGPPVPGNPQSNIVRVDLENDIELDEVKLDRNFYSTSSCGICGKASLEALQLEGYRAVGDVALTLRPDVVREMPKTLRAAQVVFELTGGLHAAALFQPDGTLVASREDVGRHNAVDKLVGAQVLDGRVPLADLVLMVSGRVSFEILQKALAAGIPAIVAVGAPSSLAVSMAERFEMTLIGFARDGRFNVYAGASRVVRTGG